eukprot:jgi/Chlat1/2211/Chrsp17S00163
MVLEGRDSYIIKKECGNCGADGTGEVALSRRNDFADALEQHGDAEFAGWLRKHNKIGVLRDDEVGRILEKEQSLQSMYGLANPAEGIVPPKYSEQERERIIAAANGEREARAQLTAKERHWMSIKVDPTLGADMGTLKWRQTQACVELYLLVGDDVGARDVEVVLTSMHLRIVIKGEVCIMGELAQPIKRDDSTWMLEGGVLELVMLKRNRRGFYEDKTDNRHTFWWSLVASGPRLEGEEEVPNAYFNTEYDTDITIDKCRPKKMRGATRTK